MREVFVANLELLMNKRGWKPDQIAPHAGVSRGTIYKYLSGERSPHMETADKIARVFGMTLRDMLVPISESHADSLARLTHFYEQLDSANKASVMNIAESLARPRKDENE